MNQAYYNLRVAQRNRERLGGAIAMTLGLAINIGSLITSDSATVKAVACTGGTAITAIGYYVRKDASKELRLLQNYYRGNK